jgi:hypothetical protein
MTSPAKDYFCLLLSSGAHQLLVMVRTSKPEGKWFKTISMVWVLLKLSIPNVQGSVHPLHLMLLFWPSPSEHFLSRTLSQSILGIVWAFFGRFFGNISHGPHPASVFLSMQGKAMLRKRPRSCRRPIGAIQIQGGGRAQEQLIPLNYPVGWYVYKTCMIICLNSFKMINNIRVLRVLIYICIITHIYIHTRIYIYVCMCLCICICVYNMKLFYIKKW